jgi:hypothetical protein
MNVKSTRAVHSGLRAAERGSDTARGWAVQVIEVSALQGGFIGSIRLAEQARPLPALGPFRRSVFRRSPFGP